MRVDTDDFARPCGCGKNHHVEVKEILIEEGAVEKLEEAMSDRCLYWTLRSSMRISMRSRSWRIIWKKILT